MNLSGGYPLVICYIAIENGPFSSLICPLKMVIFHINHHVPMVSHGFRL